MVGNVDLKSPVCEIEGMALYEIDVNRDKVLGDCSIDLFSMAIKETSDEVLKDMGIILETGTIVRISIADHCRLWKTYKSQMLKAHEKLESLIENILKCIDGMLVKITQDSFICFFSDKEQRNSMLRGIYTACLVNKDLKGNPLCLSTSGSKDTLKTQIVLANGPVYRRKLHIQKKILSDYHGSLVDIVQGCKVPLEHEGIHLLRTRDEDEEEDVLKKEILKNLVEEESQYKISMNPAILKKLSPKTSRSYIPVENRNFCSLRQSSP